MGVPDTGESVTLYVSTAAGDTSVFFKTFTQSILYKSVICWYQFVYFANCDAINALAQKRFYGLVESTVDALFISFNKYYFRKSRLTSLQICTKTRFRIFFCITVRFRIYFHFCFEGQDISLLHISIVKMSLHSRRGSKHTAAYITPLSSLCDLISFGLSQERQKVPSVSSSHHINLNSIILHHI